MEKGSPRSPAELFRFLQDPHLVARFQHICGVRGLGKRGGSPLCENSPTDDAGHLEFVVENRFLYYLFTFGTELGNELFYLSFFPFLLWNVDVPLGRRLIMVWVWVMYLGQCTKDLLGWSRPASPPVVKVELLYDSEYGMPSTHAMSATAIPFALFFLTFGRWQYSFWLGLAVALCWCLLVCVSRIYMGMHSFLDVMAGVAYSALILPLLLPALDAADELVASSGYAAGAAAAVHAALGLLSSGLDGWSTSRADTARILGSGAGVALGSRAERLLGLLPPGGSPAGGLSLAALRWLAGVPVLLATRALTEALLTAALQRRPRSEIPRRYLVYGAVGFNVLFLAPLVFRLLRLN
ncbi:sphingosine-1-phosphate phosphatase 1-like [Corythoichthys intestinalis]|uniref:sphingosine-1-phosphate phosphatase 1-like n=1 Tax=Corythoichthys intestinalis TaxID=161448 RepID=UPI0025A505FA|nr:sphingosine-1-phosphate phosphatase 1-like [Corythoichthys intestinalis]